MVTCPNCRTEAEPAARFCGTCGCNLEEARYTERTQLYEQGQERQYAPPPTHVHRAQEPLERQAAQAQQPQRQPQYQEQRQPQYQQPSYQQGRTQQYPPQQYDQYQQQYQSYPSYQHGGQPKSRGVAVVLALVLGLFGIMGIGHMYVGRLGRGFVILVAGLALIAIMTATGVLGVAAPALWVITLICGIALVLLWVWQIYDAYRLANEYNYSMTRSGRPAW